MWAEKDGGWEGLSLKDAREPPSWCWEAGHTEKRVKSTLGWVSVWRRGTAESPGSWRWLALGK